MLLAVGNALPFNETNSLTTMITTNSTTTSITTGNQTNPAIITSWNPFDAISYLFSSIEQLIYQVNETEPVLEVFTNLTGSPVFLDDVSGQFEDVQNETLAHLDKLEKLGEEVYSEFSLIVDNLTRIIESGDVSDSEKIEEEEQIVKLRETLKDVENEIEGLDCSNGNVIRSTVNNVISEIKDVVSADNLDLVWNKVNSAKVQTYRATNVVAKSLSSLSEIVSSFAKTVDKIERKYTSKDDFNLLLQ